MSTPRPDLAEEFATLRRDLLDAQDQLARALQTAASDPLAETALLPVIDTLRARRDATLARWGRVGLVWLLQGGEITLIPPPGLTEQPSPPDPPPVPPAPVEPPPPATPPDPPASQRELQQLRTIAPAWTRATQTQPREPDPQQLRAMLQTLGAAPQPTATIDALRADVRRLLEVASADSQALWLTLPREAQRALVGQVVARARHAQDALDQPQDVALLDKIFSSMTGFSKREQPGFVFGLMRTHHPSHGSWLADAAHWAAVLERHLPRGTVINPERALAELRRLSTEAPEDTDAIVEQALATLAAGVAPDDPRLVSLLIDRPDLLRRHARFKRLRKAIRQALDDDRSSEAELATAPHLQPDWPHWDAVRGKRAAIIGGDLREEARQRIQGAFEFASMDWVTTDHSRNLQSLANRVTSGGLDFVIVLRRFIGHDVDRIVLPACRDAGVPWISVDRGYGVTQIRLAAERFLGS